MKFMANGGGVRVPYFDHPFWPRTREEFYQRRPGGFGAGEGVGGAASRNTHLKGLPREGIVPERPIARNQVAGARPCDEDG
jgi:hypothetical protein